MAHRYYCCSSLVPWHCWHCHCHVCWLIQVHTATTLHPLFHLLAAPSAPRLQGAPTSEGWGGVWHEEDEFLHLTYPEQTGMGGSGSGNAGGSGGSSPRQQQEGGPSGLGSGDEPCGGGSPSAGGGGKGGEGGLAADNRVFRFGRPPPTQASPAVCLAGVAHGAQRLAIPPLKAMLVKQTIMLSLAAVPAG